MSHKSSQFNGDGHDSQFRIRVPHALAAGVAAFLAANGVQVSAATSDASGVTFSLAVLGTIATLAVWTFARWLVK